MNQNLSNFILNPRFPCIMAKSVLKIGFISSHELSVMDPKSFLELAYRFVEKYRSDPRRLSSLVVSFTDSSFKDFKQFEAQFWPFLKAVRKEDSHPADPRVSSDPNSEKFSFSVKGEAFFILALHPDSPRFARRFSVPTIVFNPHVQFEELKRKGLFKNIQKVIRKKDEILQGRNPMLQDFGEKSEVFQYLGKVYGPNDLNPLEEAA